MNQLSYESTQQQHAGNVDGPGSKGVRTDASKIQGSFDSGSQVRDPFDFAQGQDDKFLVIGTWNHTQYESRK